MTKGYFTEVYKSLAIQYISSKLYTNLVNSQSFKIKQVKLITFDLVQSHVIQCGRQILFQSAKINI